MVKKLFYLFIFFAPFTSFFALSAWLRVPVIINQILFLVLLVAILKKNALNIKWVVKEDLFLLVFLVLVWLSFMLGYREQRSFNHSLAYTNSIIFFFFMSKYVITFLKISSLDISKVIYKSFIMCSFIILIDFIGINYFNLSLRNIFSTVDGSTSNMDYFIRANMIRVAGVAEEPGHMAIFYNIYFGISLFYIHQKEKVYKYKWIVILFIISHFAMLSNAGIVLPFFAVIVIFLLNKLLRLKISSKQIFWGLSIISLVIIFGGVFVIFDVGQNSQALKEFFDKIFFSETAQYSSSGQRLKQWSRALFNFIKHPFFGNGPGYGVNEDAEGYLSVYLTILSDLGIIAIIFFVSFQEALVRKIIKLESIVRSFLLFSIITSFLHLMIIADFYHAPIWILFAFIQLVSKESKKQSVN